VGGFFALQGVFSLCGAFSFCVGVRIYAPIRSEALKRFLAALRWCFRSAFVFCSLLFVLLCSVTAQILLVTAFCGIGSMFIYPKIKTALNGFILACSDIVIFYHFLPL
jgi:hypothetical protein